MTTRCAGLAMLGMFTWMPLGGAHPADGPDIDVRVRIGSDRVSVALLMNLAFVDEVIDTPREDDTALHPVEYESYRQDLLAFFAATNRVRIDGADAAPTAREFEVGEPDLTLLPLFPRMGVKALLKLRLVLDYPMAAPAKQVALTWGRFPDDLALDMGAGAPPMRINVQLTARGVRERVVLGEEEPEYVWHDAGSAALDAFAPVPELRAAAPPTIPAWPGLAAVLLGLVLGGTSLRARRAAPWLAGGALLITGGAVSLVPALRGADLPSEQQALAVFLPLQENVYRAFDYVDEGEIYDALARSVHGDLLDRMYDRIYRSLILHEEGGAVSQIEAVRPLDARVERVGVLGEDGEVGFIVDARWQVDGSVYHWGHSHSRTQEYRARTTVARTVSGWRIRDQQVLEQLVVATSTTDPRGAGGGR